jgi:uncharacterized protein (TIGR02145 family)
VKKLTLGLVDLLDAAGPWGSTRSIATIIKTLLSGFAVVLFAAVPSFSQQPSPASRTKAKLLVQTSAPYTDHRDHKKYQTVRIGALIWFAENFAYLPRVGASGVFVYGYNGNSVSQAKTTGSYQKYGALYTWEEAKKLAPKGWRLPTDADWRALEEQIGIDPQTTETMGWRGKNREADSLKAGAASGFNVLFGGWRTSQGVFNFQGQHANFWVADSYDSARAYERLINYKNGSIGRDVGQKGCAFSVRYVRNAPDNAAAF